VSRGEPPVARHHLVEVVVAVSVPVVPTDNLNTTCVAGFDLKTDVCH